jgi:poly(3-hydroxybutyrate) depolymerase
MPGLPVDSASDDITPPEQVFNREKYTLEGQRKQIEKKLAPGGHIGQFMGSRTLQQTWPTIVRWVHRSASMPTSRQVRFL